MIKNEIIVIGCKQMIEYNNFISKVLEIHFVSLDSGF